MTLTDAPVVFGIIFVALVYVITFSVKVGVLRTYFVFWFAVVPIASVVYLESIETTGEYEIMGYAIMLFLYLGIIFTFHSFLIYFRSLYWAFRLMSKKSQPDSVVGTSGNPPVIKPE